jgi:hypothetical protein
VFEHRRRVYIPVRKLPGKPRRCDNARWSIGHPRHDRRHCYFLPGPLPSRSDAPPILAARWMRRTICYQSELPPLPPRPIIRLVQPERGQAELDIQAGLNGRPRPRWLWRRRWRRWRSQITITTVKWRELAHKLAAVAVPRKSKSGQWNRPNYDTLASKLGQVGFVTIPTLFGAFSPALAGLSFELPANISPTSNHRF